MASGQDITDEARADLHDTDAANLRWEDVEMLRHVNASIRSIMEIVPEANVVQEQISISDGESRQRLPAGGIKFIRAWNVDAEGPARGTSMTHVELDAMDSAFPEWTFISSHATNLNYPDPAGDSQCDHFAHDPREPSVYHVFPSFAATFDIFLTYAKFPTATTDLADTYPLGDEYFDAAVALVKARMLEKDGRHGSASDRRVDAYNDFLRALGTKVDSEAEFDPSKNRPPGDKHG